MKLSERSQKVNASMTLALSAKAGQMKTDGHDVVSFGAGEPDFNTPEHIAKAGKKAIDEGFTKYTAAAGTKDLKKAVQKKFKKDNGLDYDLDQIIISNGAKHSLFNSFQTILTPGDEVIISRPYWVSYPETVKLGGGVPVYVDAEEENSFVRTEDMTTGQDSQETQRTVLRYHTGQLRYERVESSSSEQVRYRRSQNQFDKTVEFYANFLSDLLTDVEFSGSEITEEGLIQYESEDIGSENNLSPETDAIEDVNMVVRFREDGRPESITANITTVQQQQPTQQSSSESETSESSTQEIVQEVSFSNYNSVDVPEPDWLEEADQQVEERRANQPSGNITFSESTNGEVTVTVESLENTDSVDIVVDGSISDRDVSEGETVTYDSPGSIQVIDQTESGRLVRIDTYSSG